MTVYRHTSLIRRRLGNVDTELQDNKAVSLGHTAPKIDGVPTAPGERFSFWSLAGRCSAKEGYREGLTISNGRPGRGMGGEPDCADLPTGCRH
ncbi:vancomycin resistance protein YoaR [Arthrobacter sp. CAN_A2]|uniref:VanW family protein n=1 Tax=Arthrobacter sp. CAN_A2 TaxID=2787718 RepID=UPI001A2E54C8